MLKSLWLIVYVKKLLDKERDEYGKFKTSDQILNHPVTGIFFVLLFGKDCLNSENTEW